MCAVNVHRHAALGPFNHHCLNRSLLVISLFDLIPGAQALCLLVRQVDVALFCRALFAHDFDLVPWLELGVPLVVHHLRQRQHALGLGADIHDDMGGRELEHRAFDHLVVAGCGLFSLGGKVLESGGKVFAGWFFVEVGSGRTRRSRRGSRCRTEFQSLETPILGLGLRCRRTRLYSLSASGSHLRCGWEAGFSTELLVWV